MWQAPCVSLMYARRWNYAKIQYIENHLSQTVQIPFSQMVHRSREANAACCKVLLAFTVLPATFTIQQKKAGLAPWPQSKPQLVLPSASEIGQWPQSLYSTVLLCCTAIWVWTQKRRERRAVKQFPPSESHSDPHRGNWEADPCQAVTANTFKQRVRALGRLAIREPNQQLKKKKQQL